ncbi:MULTISPECIES: OsmC family protein [Exiguobacterium]|uniref:OsmC family protein n=1 Tax=Exiguobacterium TaxID=33986 RepID=UPI001F11433B|nr:MULTISPECIES: hypothetical protein [Exiguobacterium]
MTEKPLVTMRAEGEATSVKTTVHVRDLEPFVVDEPERLGGTDAGPNPLEYLLGGVVVVYDNHDCLRGARPRFQL